MRRRNCGYCAPIGRPGNSTLKALGVLLLIVGLMLLIFSLPVRFWAALLGLIIAIIGWALIRYS